MSANGIVWPGSPCQQRMLAGCTENKEHAMSQNLDTSPAVVGIDIGENRFHIVGQKSARCHCAAAEVVAWPD